MSSSDPGVRCIGLDLAWGERARTGVAVLDAAGRLVRSGSGRTDDEIVSIIGEAANADLVLAIDAPLVVPNQTGRRPCEAEISRRFHRQHAGAYPANRDNPAFVPEPRGARLSHRLGATLDPTVRPGKGTSVAIEVYPHPATIVLFGLERVLPYKARPGRDLAGRIAAFTRLMDGIEQACTAVLGLDASDRWAQLRSIAAQARRPVDLRAIEDEVDAILCAYLAWLWAHHPTRMEVIGDAETGAIVIPT